jgi:hypothetical protein
VLGWNSDSHLNVIGTFPQSESVYKVFEGNHRLLALLHISEQLTELHKGDKEMITKEWENLAFDCDEQGDPLIQCAIYGAEMPITVMIGLAQCKLLTHTHTHVRTTMLL